MFARLRRNLPRAIALLALAAAAAILTGAAHATVVDYDTVATLGSGDYEFVDGSVQWSYGANAIWARLQGKLRMNNDNGSCARMRMEYFNDGVSIATKVGAHYCGTDNKTWYYTIDLNNYSDPSIDLVKVSLQKEQTETSDWEIVESAYFKPTLLQDTVKLSSDGVDFGDSNWGVGGPLGSATVDWQQGDGMNLTPRIRGTLYLNNVAGLCARIDMVYESTTAIIGEEHSGRACAPDNSRYAATIDTAPLTSDQIYDVLVKLQTQSADGSWHDVPDYYAKGDAYISADF
jgi:hypothetical protein